MKSVGLIIVGDSIIRNKSGKNSYDWSNILVKNLKKF